MVKQEDPEHTSSHGYIKITTVYRGGSDGKESVCYAGDVGSIPELAKSPGVGNSYPLWYYGLDNSMDRGAWWAIVYRVTKSQTRLSEFHIHTYRAHTEQLYMRQFSTAKDAKKKSQ